MQQILSFFLDDVNNLSHHLFVSVASRRLLFTSAESPVLFSGIRSIGLKGLPSYPYSLIAEKQKMSHVGDRHVV